MVQEKAQTDAIGLLKSEHHRIWFRRKYNLPPTDERYLNMTDAGIFQEFYIDQELKKRESEHRLSAVPHCDDCGYVGAPFHPQAAVCPECGAEMTMPDDPTSDQTTYSDDDFEGTVKEAFGIDLSKETFKPI